MKPAPAVAMLAVLSCACSGGSGDGGQPSKEARASWALVLDIDGQQVRIPLDRLDVYVVEDEDKYPEVFEMTGPGVALVGEFPMDLHVGYEEDWPKLFGRSIAVSPERGDPREPKRSQVTPPGGATLTVLGGTLTPEKLTGKLAGSEGDRTLHGRVSLRVQTPSGEKTIEGTFAAQAVTWG